MIKNASLANKLDKNRIIEINNLGKFYVFGCPPYAYTKYEKESKKGFILVEKVIVGSKANILFKMNDINKLVAPAMFASEAMADEVCSILNRKIK